MKIMSYQQEKRGNITFIMLYTSWKIFYPSWKKSYTSWEEKNKIFESATGIGFFPRGIEHNFLCIGLFARGIGF